MRESATANAVLLMALLGVGQLLLLTGVSERRRGRSATAAAVSAADGTTTTAPIFFPWSLSSLFPSNSNMLKKKERTGASTSEVAIMDDDDERSEGRNYDDDGKRSNGGGNKPTFVFFLGLEGTGHHFVKTLLKGSPASRYMRRRDKGAGAKMTELADELFHSGKGLMDAYCREDRVVDTVERRDNVVTLLRDITAEVANATASSGTDVAPNSSRNNIPPSTIALNANGFRYMMSYPMGGIGSCSSRLKSPRLDVLYDACDRAGVRCEHAYLYRDPYEVLYSTTTKRGFNPTLYRAMHLYTHYLQVFLSHLVQYPSQTAGCFGLYEPGVTGRGLWNDRYARIIRNLTGWEDADEFETYFDSVYKPPSSSAAEMLRTESNRNKVLFVEQLLKKTDDDDVNNNTAHEAAYRPYVDAFVRAHGAVVELCKKQVAVNSAGAKIVYDKNILS